MLKVVTKSARETKVFASRLTRNLSRLNLTNFSHAQVIALEGNLGAGKTTFVQGFAQALGIKENVLSPTFVLLKIYSPKRGRPKHLIHIDCYRLGSPVELLHLGFKNLLRDKDAIILIEWADRVRRIIPRHATWIKFSHGKHYHERMIQITDRAAKLRGIPERFRNTARAIGLTSGLFPPLRRVGPTSLRAGDSARNNKNQKTALLRFPGSSNLA